MRYVQNLNVCIYEYFFNVSAFVYLETFLPSIRLRIINNSIWSLLTSTYRSIFYNTDYS